MQQFISVNSINEAKKELKKLGTSTIGVEVMSIKMFSLPIKIRNLSPGEANIIKQEMICSGGDAAVAKGVAEGTNHNSDLIIMGNLSIYKKFMHRLHCHETHNFPKIREEFKALLDSFHNKKKSILIEKLGLNPSQPNVMGILNITPDSFSDGSDFINLDDAVERALQMVKDGAKIIDIGGESSRPGAKPVSLEVELQRVIPVIQAIRNKTDVLISIDTYKAEVAHQAIKAGANMINDIFAMRKDPEMIKVLQDNPEVPICLMHMLGTPETMQKNPKYDDLILEELKFFAERIKYCEENGVFRDRIILDPGIGFGKRHVDNLILLRKLEEFHTLGVPILLGTSRKSFINLVYKSEPKDRLTGTLATTALACQNDVTIIRVHDVLENVRMIDTMSQIFPE